MELVLIHFKRYKDLFIDLGKSDLCISDDITIIDGSFIRYDRTVIDIVDSIMMAEEWDSDYLLSLLED